MLPNYQNRDKSKAILGLSAALFALANHKNKMGMGCSRIPPVSLTFNIFINQETPGALRGFLSI
ncbi:hypothetical protein [Pandoraea sp.]|uniref:hypothetical protein n=1 Tax=Pandoraea sp. TaxID=1883445 RepID=UPI00121E8861|nr:hypothetical protein [Pandoraea sp.]TAL56149.1 MAG: hypothetical protein EPN80_05160 [Pandoraea sp.]TAM16720.1 MAG: hypothetical protein EPN65_13570 [Pandoraea sp.]